jgi:N-acylglucosamine-6-phosphate 2-epimerase
VHPVLERLRGKLIVSVQAWPGSAIDDPYVLAALAAAAEANGAAGVRIEGAANLRAVRARTSVPAIGIVKARYEGFAPYITPTLHEARAVIETGAEIVAFDATARARPGGVTAERIVEEIHAAGRLAMADCATAEDGRRAHAAGAELVATTLCGYTHETRGSTLPALALVRAWTELRSSLEGGAFVVCEGGVHEPGQVADALRAGADAVVVGTAITNIDWLVREFAARAAN